MCSFTTLFHFHAGPSRAVYFSARGRFTSTTGRPPRGLRWCYFQHALVPARRALGRNWARVAVMNEYASVCMHAKRNSSSYHKCQLLDRCDTNRHDCQETQYYASAVFCRRKYTSSDAASRPQSALSGARLMVPSPPYLFPHPSGRPLIAAAGDASAAGDNDIIRADGGWTWS